MNLKLVFVIIGFILSMAYSVHSQDGIICTADYDPWCGSDHQTYSNSCKLGEAQRINPKLTATKGECH